MSTLQKEPGSFRDPLGYIVYTNNEIYRLITHKAKKQFDVVRQNKLLGKLIQEGKLIDEEHIDLESIKERVSHDYSNISCAVKHSKLDFISYPYEWPFSLLKKAALFHLDLQLELLEANLTLSDASAYNVQFIGSKPIFIDSLSIIPYVEGEYWIGYSQFCQHFLYPLLMQYSLNIPYHSLLRSNLEGISLDYIYNLLPLNKKFNCFN
jgi:ribosomal protein L11 methylase PrmA